MDQAEITMIENLQNTGKNLMSGKNRARSGFQNRTVISSFRHQLGQDTAIYAQFIWYADCYGKSQLMKPDRGESPVIPSWRILKIGRFEIK